jgi:biotin carboxylase
MMKYLLVVDHFVSSIPAAAKKFRQDAVGAEIGFLFLTRNPGAYTHINTESITLITKQCSFEDDEQMRDLLAPYLQDIAGVICRGDKQVQFLRRLVPFLPEHVPVSSAQSLEAATNKRMMRELFTEHAPEITPQYVRVRDTSPSSIEAVEAAMAYPVIVKPASLVSSLLIQKCLDRAALQQALDTVFETAAAIYAREDRRGEIEVIVEEYLEGDFYSVDAYIRDADAVYYCPPVAYIPAQQIGIDDFFLYKRFVPTELSEQDIQDSFVATKKALLALGLRYSAAHVELIKTKSGWRIIEVGPRLGRFRNSMYKLGYGIDHSYNDIAVHLDKEPVIANELQQYCAAYSIYPEKEGTLQSIEGLEGLRQNPLVHSLKVFAEPGQTVKYAKNGGKALAEFIIASPDMQAFEELKGYVERQVHAIV